MIPISKVRDLISKHKSLEKELSSGEIDKKKFAEVVDDFLKFIDGKSVVKDSVRNFFMMFMRNEGMMDLPIESIFLGIGREFSTHDRADDGDDSNSTSSPSTMTSSTNLERFS